jgi:uncharacterized membrane protein
MVIYHFCFDLNYFGAIHLNMNDSPFWLGFRALILSTFLGVAGVSLVLAAQAGATRFWRRLGVLALCSALVSVVSYALFAERWIFFGVLHFILLASLLGTLLLRGYWLNLVLGVALIAAGVWGKFPLFDQPWLQWVGMMTFKPPTEDYVPLLPWFGVVLLGMFGAQTLLQRENLRTRLAAWHPPPWLLRGIAFAGRHSLAVYMLHQPLLMGLLYLWFWLRLG